MEFLAQLATWSLLAFSLLLFLTQVAAREVGYWLGQRQHAARGKSEAEGVGLVVGGMLGLLAFVLALTLSFGSSRFNERRQGTLAEANAIGTAWLRAEAIGHPRGAEIARLLRLCAAAQGLWTASRNRRRSRDQSTRLGAAEGDLGTHVRHCARTLGPSGYLANGRAQSDFDMSTGSARVAHDSRFPPPLFWLLIGMALISMAALGYQLGLEGPEVPYSRHATDRRVDGGDRGHPRLERTATGHHPHQRRGLRLDFRGFQGRGADTAAACA